MAISLSRSLVLYPVVLHFPYSWTSQCTHTSTKSHTPPPCRQPIYREVITPVNDGKAELEPISAANMTNSTPTLNTHTNKDKDLPVYVSSNGVYKCRQSGVCVCVIYAHYYDHFFWRVEKLIFSVTSCAALWCIVLICVCGLSHMPRLCRIHMWHMCSSLWAYWYLFGRCFCIPECIWMQIEKNICCCCLPSSMCVSGWTVLGGMYLHLTVFNHVLTISVYLKWCSLKIE